jgi:hypothetical protein
MYKEYGLHVIDKYETTSSACKQCTKWAGICPYNIGLPELIFIPEFHTGTYQYINKLKLSHYTSRRRFGGEEV